MYSALIFLLGSSNFFLPFTCLCPFFWSVVIPMSQPLWTWLSSSLGALFLFLSGSLSCLLDLLLGSGPLVLSPWSWSFSSGSLVPLAQAVCSTTVCLVDGFIVLCNMWVDFATVVLSARSKVCFKERTHGRIFVTVIVGGLLFQSRWYIP